MDNIQNTIENMLIAGEIDQNGFFGNKNKDKNTNRTNNQQNKSENTDDEE